MAKKNSVPKREFEIPAIGIIDNIIIGRKSVWAYFKLTDKPYLFLSNDLKVGLAQATMTAIGALCQSANKKVDCHLLISNQPFNPEAWEEDIIQRYLNYNQGKITNHKAFQKFITDQAESLYLGNYQKRTSYLGVKLGNRAALDTVNINPLEFGFKEAFASFRAGLNFLFKFDEHEITADEEKKFRQLESTVYNTLSAGSLRAQRVSSEELLLVCKRRLYPSMPTPYLETDYENRVGLSDVVLETGSEIEEFSRHLEIIQICSGYELKGCRATLSFSKFPKDLMFPGTIPPFLHRAVMLPYTANCRFSLIPTEEMKNKLNKKKLSTEDEINNLVEAGQRPTEGLKATMRDQQVLESDLEEEGLPWISGSYRITVEAENIEYIREIVENLKLEYAEHGFTLTWTSGDQLDLLREEMPGGELKVKDFSQITNLAILGLAGINYGGKTGDPVKQSAKMSMR